MPMFSAIHGIHCFPLVKLTFPVGPGLTLVCKTSAICGQNLYSVCSWSGPVPTLPTSAVHGTPLQMLCFLQ